MSFLNIETRVTFHPSVAQGKASAPPSKSEAHRLLIASALSKEECFVNGIIQSDDMMATLDSLRATGIYTVWQGDVVEMNAHREVGVPTPPLQLCEGKIMFPCYESGSTLRFLIPIALALYGGGCFMGTKRLIQRGVEVYAETLKQDGVKIDIYDNVIFVDGTLKGGKYTVRGDVSSQYISGLMFALPLLECDSEIEVSEPFESRQYVDMTIDVLSKFGVEVKKIRENLFSIKGNQCYQAGNFDVEGDWSNGAFLLALNELGGDVLVEGLRENSLQGDKVCKQIFRQLNDKNPVIDLANCPDLAPVAFVVAAVKNGAHFTNTRRLKIKESSRADAMAQELSKFGIAVDVHENDVYVHKNDIQTPECMICGHNDHRIVMALSVLMSKYGGVMDDVDAVEKSYPNFFDVLKSLGVSYEVDHV